MKTMPWDEQQQQALWEAAEHWLENWEDPENATIYSDDCPLCDLYVSDGCKRCPIALHTGRSGCLATPLVVIWPGVEKGVKRPQELKDAMEEEYRMLIELALGERQPQGE